MAGHSHWAGIKHKKKIVDAKRGKLFSKLAKNIMTAARMGGGNPDTNLDLGYAIQRAKDANMNKDNIERAIKKGTGELPGQSLEWVMYEGYLTGGVAVIVQALTDNKNRTVAEIRNLFEKNSYSLGAPGCVAWMFEQKGLITIEETEGDEEELMLVALDAGAEDVTLSGGLYEITTPAEKVRDVRKALEESGLKVQSSEVSHIPSTTVNVDDSKASKILSFLEKIEEHEDVQNVFANFEISEELMESLTS